MSEIRHSGKERILCQVIIGIKWRVSLEVTKSDKGGGDWATEL